MANQITEREYWREVASTAKSIKSETRARGSTTEEWLERAQERVHETVDGHQWIIYTWAQPWVLIHSRNENAYFDEVGPLEASDYSDAMTKLAFYAFYADVMAELQELFS